MSHSRRASQPFPSRLSARSRPPGRTVRVAGRKRGKRTTSEAAAASPISTRSELAVPILGINTRLKTRAPAMAPIVLAA